MIERWARGPVGKGLKASCSELRVEYSLLISLPVGEVWRLLQISGSMINDARTIVPSCDCRLQDMQTALWKSQLETTRTERAYFKQNLRRYIVLLNAKTKEPRQELMSRKSQTATQSAININIIPFQWVYKRRSNVFIIIKMDNVSKKGKAKEALFFSFQYISFPMQWQWREGNRKWWKGRNNTSHLYCCLEGRTKKKKKKKKGENRHME